jgi:hypothetical protein
MSMLEIQELTRRWARSLQEIEKAFERSADQFFNSWIPEELRRTHPVKALMGVRREDGLKNSIYVGQWALRLTAIPLSPLIMSDLSRLPWVQDMKPEAFNGPGRQGSLTCYDLEVVSPWKPRLRAMERLFRGDNMLARDVLTSEGRIERFIRGTISAEGPRPQRMTKGVIDIVWNVASVLRMIDTVRAQNSRPGQKYALEVEFTTSDPMRFYAYAGTEPSGIQPIPAEAVVFPRYEIGDTDTFNQTLTDFDRDMWNLSSIDPGWELAVNWPPATAPSKT